MDILLFIIQLFCRITPVAILIVIVYVYHPFAGPVVPSKVWQGILLVQSRRFKRR